MRPKMESEDPSLETTVPTDLSISISADDSELEIINDRRKKVTKHLYEKKQLLHDVQVLKIELSQKNLLIDNLKADHMQKIEELQEKLGEVSHQKQILQVKLESQLNIQKDDSRRRQDQVQKELDLILKKQQKLESTNAALQERAGNIRKSLLDLDLTENQYLAIKSQNEDEISLRDYIATKVFEALRPWRIHSEELKTRLRILTDELHRSNSELEACQEDLGAERKRHDTARHELQKVTVAYADTKSKVQQGDYKIENYDKVKSERDELEQNFSDATKQLSQLEATYHVVTRERDELTVELGSVKQNNSLLRQDKEYLAKQNSEFSSKLLYAEERIVQLNDQVDRAKQSREELYDKYVASRDSYKSEFEKKLQEELEAIRSRTNMEVDRLKAGTRDMYERENRGYREARDLALSERDRAFAAEREMSGKYNELLEEFRQTQMNSDNKMTDLQNETRLKSFEKDRTQLVYEETVRNLKNCQTENEKLQKKLEVLSKEYYTMEASLEKRVAELEAIEKEKNIKLETYEKLEQELDDVVMHAADAEHEADAEKVLFSYGYGANVPTTAKRRLQQSVHLARRVLQLERTNASMKKDVEDQKTRNKELADELKNTNGMLDQTQQPYTYLIESIRLRDQQLGNQKKVIHNLEDDVRTLQQERDTLAKSKNALSADLEKLLNQREEMSVMKNLITNLSHRRQGVQGTKSDADKVKGKAESKTNKGNSVKQVTTDSRRSSHWEPAEPDENVHKPPPTQFTSKNIPGWYSKLGN